MKLKDLLKQLIKQLVCKHRNLEIIKGHLIAEHIFCKECGKCLTKKQ